MDNLSPSLDTLADGLSSPFWDWFKQHVETEWGAGGEMPPEEAGAAPMAQGQGVM